MRILVVSNLYPPEFIGGYELGCKMLVDEFVRRKHHVDVLTSGNSQEPNILRLFPFFGYSDFRSSHEVNVFADQVREARERLKEFLSGAKYDVVLLFNPAGIPAVLTELIQQAKIPIAALVSDDWPMREAELDHFSSSWLNHTRGLAGCYNEKEMAEKEASLIQQEVLGIPSPWPIGKVCFVSQFLQTLLAKRFTDLNSSDRHITHWGLPAERYGKREGRESRNKILYCSQLVEKKGALDLVRAVDKLRARGILMEVGMYGTAPVESEQKRLRDLIQELRLDDKVKVHPAVPRERLIGKIMEEYDIFILGSLHYEPFSIAALEAMRAGLAVVTTGTGGGAELFQDKKNCLIYKGSDPDSLAGALELLHTSSGVYNALTASAMDSVAPYTIERMADEILDSLMKWKPKTKVEQPRKSSLTRYLEARLARSLRDEALSRQKDAYSESLQESVRQKDTYVASMEAALAEKDKYLKSMEGILKEKDTYVQSMEAALKAKEQYIGSLTRAVEESNLNARSCEKLALEREEYAKSLEGSIKEKDIYISSLQGAVASKEEHAVSLGQTLREKEERLKSLDADVRGKAAYIKSLEENLKQKELYIQSLEHTVAFKVYKMLTGKSGK